METLEPLMPVIVIYTTHAEIFRIAQAVPSPGMVQLVEPIDHPVIILKPSLSLRP